ncbi:MAG: LytTR family DNA-binding domain-containing protein [Ignavibacteria bacterium]|jgi:DNA-binding LytR/AlgR family response regulator
MKVIIIEDEKSNAKRLKKMLNEIDDSIVVETILENVDESISYLSNNSADLIFMDVQLSDGICFEIFDTVNVDIPIIFTTAYDEYAIKAFKVNSIDYLLKPIDSQELKKSINKYNSLKRKFSNDNNINNLLESLKGARKNFKTRFLVKHGKQYKSISVDDIVCFRIENQLVYLCDYEGKTYIIDIFLDELEKSLDSEQFFRVNRQNIININYIKSMVNYPGNRLKIIFTIPFEKVIIVSREKVSSVKEWLNK